MWRDTMKEVARRRINEPASIFEDMWRSLQRIYNDFTPLVRSFPAVDIREDEENYFVDVELPGMDEKDVDVSIHNNVLQIASKHEEKTEESRAGYIVRERRSSSFKRSFRMPENADRENVDAKFHQGLLTIRIRKLDSGDKTKHIKISRETKTVSKVETKAESQS
jgi:HSP20 family protein